MSRSPLASLIGLVLLALVALGRPAAGRATTEGLMEPRARTAQQLVEHQITRARLLDAALAGVREVSPATLPVITLSREFGARGSAVGALLASRLGFSLWDQELVHVIASETGAQAALLKSLDEHARNALEDLINGVILGNAYTQSEYLRGLVRTVQAIARRGSAVLIGHPARPGHQPLRPARANHRLGGLHVG